MYSSYIAMNRIVEERAADDEAYRRALEKNRRPLLSHGRAMADDALLAELRSLRLDVDREGLSRLFPRFVSAQEMAEAMMGQVEVDVPDVQEDWAWIAITCLWERWQPELPSMEMVDDKMQAGYAAHGEGDTQQACRIWLETWRAILGIIERRQMRSLDEFDDLFGGTQCVYNWIHDFELQLYNAGLDEPEFFRERISLCETVISQFSNGSLSTNDFKMALAESHFQLGDREQGDRLFREWLDEEPQCGNGWTSWSHCHWPFANHGEKDAAKAEQILKEGLAVTGIRDRELILESLAQLYDETDRGDQAKAVREEVKQVRRLEKTTITGSGPGHVQIRGHVRIREEYDFGEEGLPLEELEGFAHSLAAGNREATGVFDKQPHVGRNEPCPCGSGKKYKKCCAKSERGGRQPGV